MLHRTKQYLCQLLDDDTAGFTITQTDGSSSVTEGGSTDLITVVLDKGPLTDVVITVASSDTGEATVSNSTLTFTSLNLGCTPDNNGYRCR